MKHLRFFNVEQWNVNFYDPTTPRKRVSGRTTGGETFVFCVFLLFTLEMWKNVYHLSSIIIWLSSVTINMIF